VDIQIDSMTFSLGSYQSLIESLWWTFA